MIRPIQSSNFYRKLPQTQEFRETLFKSYEGVLDQSMGFLDVANSPNQFLKIVNKLTYNNPDKNDILWDLYRKIGIKDSKLQKVVLDESGRSLDKNLVNGWSNIGYRGTPYTQHQIKVFEEVFKRQPDIGEFISYSKTLFDNEKGQMIFPANNQNYDYYIANINPLFKSGLNEIRKNPERYNGHMQASFLHPYIRSFLIKAPEFANECINTMLNLANKTFKEHLSFYKVNQQDANITSICEEVTDLLFMSNNPRQMHDLKAHDFLGTISSQSSKVYKSLGLCHSLTPKPEKMPDAVAVLDEMVANIDKGCSDYTIDRLYKSAQEEKLID